jgi:hypothetical protein
MSGKRAVFGLLDQRCRITSPVRPHGPPPAPPFAIADDRTVAGFDPYTLHLRTVHGSTLGLSPRFAGQVSPRNAGPSVPAHASPPPRVILDLGLGLRLS